MGESSLVIGAGVIGSLVARTLAKRGDRVTVVSRRGSGPAGVSGVAPGAEVAGAGAEAIVRHVAADAADAEAMARLAEGAAVVYNCVNPPYHRWPADWPPIAASVLGAANEPLSQRQVIDDFARAAAVGHVRVSEIPSVALHGMGLAWPLMRELRETEYQFRDDFIMDSSAAQASFGLKPAPWEEIVAVTVGSASR